MSNLHRILWFDDQVRSRRYPNSSSLAEKFEISNRQALRDIEYLVNTMGAPLEYIPKKRGYEYSEKTYMIPYQVITEEERKVLSFLSYRYEQFRYDNSSAVNKLASLFKKLAGKPSDFLETYPFFTVPDSVIEHLHRIHHAIEMSKRVLVYNYSHEDNRYCSEELEPITILYNGNIDYLVAYHPKHQREELISLLDIKEIRILESVESPKQKHNQLHPLHREPFSAEVLLKEDFVGESWYGYKVKRVTERVLTLEFYDAELFINQLISTSTSVTLLEPKWLKEKLVARCQEIIQSL